MEHIKKGLLIGIGALLVAIFAGLCYLAYDTRLASLEGRAALQFIRQVNSQQAPTPAPAATPAPTPAPEHKP